MHLDTGGGFDLTEAGTQKRLAVSVVRDPDEVPGVARLGPDPLADEMTLERFAALLAGTRSQLKGLLRDQTVLAGIGNAYSDEILHVAKLSPFRPAGNLTTDEVALLFDRDARDARRCGRPGSGPVGRRAQGREEAGDAGARPSRAAVPGLRRHDPEGLVRDSSLDYCPTCQTGGKPLADRRLSKLLR